MEDVGFGMSSGLCLIFLQLPNRNHEEINVSNFKN